MPKNKGLEGILADFQAISFCCSRLVELPDNASSTQAEPLLLKGRYREVDA